MILRKISALCVVAAIGFAFRTSWAQQNFPDAKARPLFSKLAVAPTKLSFGRTASQSEKFVIRNAGNEPLTIDSVSLAQNPGFVLVETPQAGSMLEPRAEATAVVAFQPPADGPFTATVSNPYQCEQGKFDRIGAASRHGRPNGLHLNFKSGIRCGKRRRVHPECYRAKLHS